MLCFAFCTVFHHLTQGFFFQDNMSGVRASSDLLRDLEGFEHPGSRFCDACTNIRDRKTILKSCLVYVLCAYYYVHPSETSERAQGNY